MPRIKVWSFFQLPRGGFSFYLGSVRDPLKPMICIALGEFKMSKVWFAWSATSPTRQRYTVSFRIFPALYFPSLILNSPAPLFFLVFYISTKLQKNLILDPSDCVLNFLSLFFQNFYLINFCSPAFKGGSLFENFLLKIKKFNEIFQLQRQGKIPKLPSLLR